MTKKDYELIADAIATVEADYKGLYQGVLEDVVDEIAKKAERENPRFKPTLFKIRAMPLLAEAKVQAVTPALRPTRTGPSYTRPHVDYHNPR